MNDLRDRVQGDPELSRDVQDLSRDLSRLSVGNTASAELEARIAREILPKLEALEVQLRRSSAETGVGPSPQRRRRPRGARLHRRRSRVLPQVEQGKISSSMAAFKRLPISACYSGISDPRGR